MEDDIEDSLEVQKMFNDMEDELRERDRNAILKFIKGKTLSEAKELVFVIKNEMPLNSFRKLH
jgi:hypothetical protein|tara:strand:- start:1332 stop:1520 length:189 start_codon:yes stop_codon:yes gene_type:complete